ncbi:MAG: hypothetical protein JXB48_05595 [Candidatus Latescibacteria bacterium]|nr:hypothetical protein [Candidatus Latescibacterota bacterium]
MSGKRNEEFIDAWLSLMHGQIKGGEIVTLPVLSGSMMPYLVPGNKIKIQSASWRDCKIGDIIIFKEKNRLSAHRLLLRCCFWGKCYLYQKGDSISTGHWIKSDRVVGVVVESENTEGQVIDFRLTYTRKNEKNNAYRQLRKDVYARLLSIPQKIIKKIYEIFRVV